MSPFKASVPQMSKMLKNLRAWLEKAEASAKERGFDVEVLMNARLAPDQYSLIPQVQAACDSAKFAAARLSGGSAPSFEDNEKNLTELQARIGKTLEYLDSVKEADFEGAEQREVVLPFLPGKACKGENYLVEMATPNFYFHLISAYAILRHNGVGLGKYDFIGSIDMYDLPEA